MTVFKRGYIYCFVLSLNNNIIIFNTNIALSQPIEFDGRCAKKNWMVVIHVKAHIYEMEPIHDKYCKVRS